MNLSPNIALYKRRRKKKVCMHVNMCKSIVYIKEKCVKYPVIT